MGEKPLSSNRSDSHAEATRTTNVEAWAIVNRLLASILLYGGLGALIGWFFGALGIGLAIGTLVGVALAMYMTTIRVKSMNDSGLPVRSNVTGSRWSTRMAQVRMRNARENSE